MTKKSRMSRYESLKELFFNESSILLLALEKYKHSRIISEFTKNVWHMRAWLFSSKKYDHVFDVKCSEFIIENNGNIDAIAQSMRKDVTIQDYSKTLRCTWKKMVEILHAILDEPPRTITRFLGLFYTNYHKQRRIHKDRIKTILYN